MVMMIITFVMILAMVIMIRLPLSLLSLLPQLFSSMS